MAPNSHSNVRRFAPDESDPRDGQGAEVIDLATRNVLPQVTQRKKADGLGLAAGVLIVAALGGLTLWTMDAARNAPVQPDLAATPAIQPATPAPAPLTPQRPLPAPMPAAPLAAPAPAPVLAAAPNAAPAAQGNPFANPTVVYDSSAGPAGAAAPAPGPGAPGDAKAPAGGDDFAARIGGTNATASAARSFNPATTVTQGTLIPAVLETAIDTEVPGYVRAIVSTDVRSFDGRHVLIPRSSRLIGQYKSGLTAGQKRAYVIWTRVIRPDGVSVDIGSPAIAFGGETGLSGKVNTHFFARFGSAILLSVVDGLTALASSGSSVVIAGGSSAAAQAVQGNSQIGPTIRVRQGEPIRVFTAKDLDFGPVQ
ncbi:TrbI/VirB10 family protein [Novosphingobium profundi]|uniref:TrbI/VirB10 family protein n=1 Tax=Novosphingobium profundi TaxID=1774954 RepID=UPI001BD93BF8|nr:TrbI/VirB10 family protein [Novosphingobium profundi]MBT0669388.1 TrbI/VirB10 family protein [Novosphingobium profundi]